MNAIRAANHSPSRIAYLVLEEDDLLFRWSPGDGQLLMFKRANPENIELVGLIAPDEADQVLNIDGWKPADTDNWLQSWAWATAYAIGRALHLPGFRKVTPPTPTVESPVEKD